MSQKDVDAVKDEAERQTTEDKDMHWLFDTDPTRLKKQIPGRRHRWVNKSISARRGTDRGWTFYTRKEAKDLGLFDPDDPLVKGGPTREVERGELALGWMSEERARAREGKLRARQQKPQARSEEQMTDAIASVFKMRTRDVKKLIEELRGVQGR